jgi:hypothetical protein
MVLGYLRRTKNHLGTLINLNGEGQQVQGHQDGREVALAVTEAVLDVVSLGLENVKVSFSIFQRARPQAASSATLWGPTGKSVTKLLR